MRALFLYLVFSFALYEGMAQRSLGIDLYHFGHFRRLHIYPHSPFVFKLKGSRYTYHDTLMAIQDSIIYISTGERIAFREIRKIKIDRSNWLTRKLYKTAIQGSIFIVAIDALNNIGNKRPTIVDKPVAIITASAFTAGWIGRWLCKRHVRIGKHARLVSLDVTPK